MKLRFRGKRDYNQNWVQTATSILALVFALLVTFGVITAEQSSQGLQLATNIITTVGGLIASVIALIGVLFKPAEPEL